MKKVKVAVVGCGFIARKQHIPGFVRLKKCVDLCAVCDKNEDVASQIAKDYSIPKVYSDLSDMLSHEDLDVIDICTPPQIHVPLALEAIKNGCHVLMEKPMALTVSDCDQMIDASHRQGVKLCVVHNNIFHPPFPKARKIVEDGIIGDFAGMKIFLSTPRGYMLSQKDHWVHKLPGGVLGETGPHAVYMSLAFLKNVRNIDIYAKNILNYHWAPFDEFRIELEGENGISSIALSYASDIWAADVDILGTKGMLHLDIESMLLVHYRRKELGRMSIVLSSLNIASQMMRGIASNIMMFAVGRRQKSGHDVVIEKFVDSILNGSQPPVTGEEGRETVRIMETIVKKLYQKYACYPR